MTPMQTVTKIILFLILILVCHLTHFPQKPIKIMQPEAEFDVKQAMDMLNGGNSQIKGVAYYEERTPIGIKVGETIYARTGTVVFLYPLTAYINEYLSLKKKNKQGKRLAAISPIANSFRIESKVYSQTGDFSFIGLKPGKYYLETLVYFPSGVGGREASGIVEIKADGDVVNYKLNYIY